MQIIESGCTVYWNFANELFLVDIFSVDFNRLMGFVDKNVNL